VRRHLLDLLGDLLNLDLNVSKVRSSWATVDVSSLLASTLVNVRSTMAGVMSPGMISRSIG
jgi:hypothetical protein